MRTTVGAVLACTSLLTFAAACSDDDSDSAAPSSPTATVTATVSAAPAGPTWDGPELPGLAKSPAWSMSYREGTKVDTVPVGESIAVAQSASDYEGPARSASPSSSASGAPLPLSPGHVVEFRDAATGEVRNVVRTPMTSIRSDVWGGKPVAVVTYQMEIPSDGLSEEKKMQYIVGYDATGTKVAEVTAEGEEDSVAVQDGMVVRRTPDSDTGRASATVQPVGGGPAGTVRCTVALCGIATNTRSGASVRAVDTAVKAVVGPLAFTLISDNATSPSRLAAVDPASGRQLWTSATIQAPPNVAAESDLQSLRARPVAMVGDKLLLNWVKPGFSGVVLALHEPRTGKLLFAGPELPGLVDTVFVDPDGEYVVVSSDDSASEYATAVWSLTDGKVLWQQEKAEGQKALAASALVNGVIYGLVAEDRALSTTTASDYLVVDARTKKVLATDLSLVGTPLVVGKYAFVQRQGGLFAFPAA